MKGISNLPNYLIIIMRKKVYRLWDDSVYCDTPLTISSRNNKQHRRGLSLLSLRVIELIRISFANECSMRQRHSHDRKMLVVDMSLQVATLSRLMIYPLPWPVPQVWP